MVENKRCILIADDEPKMVRALRDFFNASGFCVLEAKDGVEALDVFCENSNVIDMILLDVMMPRQKQCRPHHHRLQLPRCHDQLY